MSRDEFLRMIGRFEADSFQDGNNRMATVHGQAEERLTTDHDDGRL